MLQILRCLGIAIILLMTQLQAAHATDYVTVRLTVEGNERQVNGQWEQGLYTVSFGRYSQSIAYGQFSTASSIAAGIAAKFSQDSSAGPFTKLCLEGICAKADGPLVTFQIAYPAMLSPIVVSTTSPSFRGNTVGWPSITTSITLSPLPNTLPTGQPVQINTVLDQTSATGYVLYLDGTNIIGVSAVVWGQATYLAPAFSLGQHSISVAYSGDSKYLSSRSPATTLVSVLPQPVVTGLTFDVTQGATSFDTLEGPPLAGFVITGANFGPNNSTPGTYVSIGANEITILSWSANRIVAQIPATVVPSTSALPLVIHLPSISSDGTKTFTVTAPTGCITQ